MRQSFQCACCLGFFILLAACTQTRVHLVSMQQADTEKQAIEKILQSHELSFSETRLMIPPAKRGIYILYGGSDDSLSIAETLSTEIESKLQKTASLYYGKIDNSFVSFDSVAVYVIPETISPDTAAEYLDTQNTDSSFFCDAKGIELILFADQARLKFSSWDEDGVNEVVIAVKDGQYNLQNKTFTLFLEGKENSYTVGEATRLRQSKPLTYRIFSPLDIQSPELESCYFSEYF